MQGGDLYKSGIVSIGYYNIDLENNASVFEGELLMRAPREHMKSGWLACARERLILILMNVNSMLQLPSFKLS